MDLFKTMQIILSHFSWPNLRVAPRLLGFPSIPPTIGPLYQRNRLLASTGGYDKTPSVPTSASGSRLRKKSKVLEISDPLDTDGGVQSRVSMKLKHSHQNSFCPNLGEPRTLTLNPSSFTSARFASTNDTVNELTPWYCLSIKTSVIHQRPS